MKPGAVLVTYCAKGQVKRDLKSLGLVVESHRPPGERDDEPSNLSQSVLAADCPKLIFELNFSEHIVATFVVIYWTLFFYFLNVVISKYYFDQLPSNRIIYNHG